MVNLITEHIDIWTAAQIQKANGGRGRGKNSNSQSPHGIKKLRELILELAVRGKLVPQNPNYEPASELLEKIAKEKDRLIKEGKIKKQKPLPGIGVDEKPFELPVGWEWVRLGSISQISPRNEAENNLTVSFIPMTLISTSHTGDHGQEIKTWDEIKKGYTHFADGDIGVAKITPCFENSKAVVLSGLENGIGAGTTELHIARPFGTTLAPRYILLFLKAPMFLHVGKTKMTGTAGQKRIPKEFFSETPLPLPSLAEQHRIVAKVDELMALCDHLEQQQTDSDSIHQTLVETLLATLTGAADQREFIKAWQRIANHFDTLFTTEQSIDQLKQTILQLAIMGKLVPQDPNDEPASVLLEKIAKEKVRLIKEGKIKKQKALPGISEDEKIFELPVGWAWSRLDDLALRSEAGWSPKCESAPREGEDWGVLKVSAITWGRYNPNENKALPSSLEPRAEYEVMPGDFLISRANTSELVARAVVVAKDAPARLMMSDKTIRFVFSLEVSVEFVNLANSSLSSRDYYARVAGGTSSSMKNVSRNQIRTLVIALPPILEQLRIVAKVDELMVICDTLKSRLNGAQTTQVQLADAIVEQAVA